MLTDDETLALRSKALSLCRDFLGGKWKSLKEDDFIFSRISGGLSNYLFKCRIPDNIECVDVPRSVILRVYGRHLVGRTSEILKDTTVSLLLSEWRIGPKVYAVRGSSRLEQFFEAITLKTEHLHNLKLRRQIARTLSRFHSFEMPLMKEPRWFFDTTRNYLEKIASVTFEQKNDQLLYKQLIEKVDFGKEFADLCEILSEVDSQVVFCHNDVQPGNLLLLETGELKLIDYEYSAYNHRGFDIGNFFCEFMFNYSCNTYPFFKCNFNAYPSLRDQQQFIEEYVYCRCSAAKEKSTSVVTVLDAGKRRTEMANGYPGLPGFAGDTVLHEPHKLVRRSLVLARDENIEDVENIMRETSYFSLASNFMWAMWSIFMASESRIDFGYMEYGICRLFAYFYGKRQILNPPKERATLNQDVLSCEFNKPGHFFNLIRQLPV